MSTVLRSRRSVNSHLSAIAWHALLKSSEKEAKASRDDLAAGGVHSVDLTVAGTIDGESYYQPLSAIVTVGHDSTRATSATPDLDQLIGSILAKLNTATREAVFRDLPEEFAAAGCELPDVPADIAEKTAAMLQRLRAKKSVSVRGSVSCKYKLQPVDAVEATESAFAVVG